jgi:uncharacterized delta-60 repeat protein
MKNLIPALILLFILSHQSLLSQPGTLDPSFGTGGKVTSSSGANDYSAVSSVALQQDGKIIATGYTYNSITSAYEMKTVRYNANGTLDNTFGKFGIVTMNIGSVDDEGTSVLVQPNGKILVSGYTDNNTNKDFLILRMKTDGSLDSTFGINGIVTKDYGGQEYSYCMALQSNGKILICGPSSNGASEYFTMLRYNSNGTIDNTFGTSGKTQIQMGAATDDVPYSMQIQSDGKIVIGGFSFSTITTLTSIAIIRIDSNGTMDNGFGSLGKIISNLNAGGDMVFSIALQPDGKILATGQSDRVSTDLLLLRYTSAGLPDSAFGNNGVVYYDHGLKSDQGTSVMIQPDGKILVAGNMDSVTTDFALFRYTSTGVLDNSFGTGGIVVTDFSNNDFAYTMLLQPDRKIVLAGQASTADFGLLRYNGDSLRVDGALSNLTVPANKCGAMGNVQTVSMTITNNGNSIINAGAAGISLQVSGANTGTYNESNPFAINVGANTTLAFNTVNLPNTGNNVITALLTLVADANTLNNTVTNNDTAFLAKPVVAFSSTNASNTYNFTSNVTGRAPITYEWTFGDGSANSTQQNPSHHYPFIGAYTVKLVAADACGTDSTTQTFTITTGINNINADHSISVFPNPANNEIRIKYISLNVNIKVSLSDVLGNVIQNTELNNGEAILNTSLLPDGIYLLKVQDAVTKIFVRH